MIKLESIPDGIEAIREQYGDPGKVCSGKVKANRSFVQDNLRLFSLSFPLRQSWDQKQLWGFYAHKLVGPAMVDALEEIQKRYGLAYMRTHNLDYWGGVHNPRVKRGSTELSTHAWGIAIDYLPQLGEFARPAMTPYWVVEAFTQRGFYWGGAWTSPDGMHFQACGGY